LIRSSFRLLGFVALLCAFIPAGTALAVPPSNDNYLASSKMVRADGTAARFFHDVVDTREATTQPDEFQPDKDGMALGGGPAEPTSCPPGPGQAPVSFGNTVWYDFAPEVPGGVEITAAGFDTSVVVYRFSPQTSRTTAVVACQNLSAGPSEDVQIPSVAGGASYTVQVGGAAGAAGIAAGLLDFTFRFFPDRDGDGVFDETPDRCPALPGIQAAGGCPPTVAAAMRFAFRGTGHGVRLTRLSVVHVPQGSRVEARCVRCDISERLTVKGSSGSVRLAKFLSRPLPAGGVIQVFVTHPRTGSGPYRFGAFGTMITARVLSNALAGPVTRCLRPGSRTPRKRCA
jgi:hypothetical protein